MTEVRVELEASQAHEAPSAGANRANRSFGFPRLRNVRHKLRSLSTVTFGKTVGDVPFVLFTLFWITLFSFALFIDVLLLVVTVRAEQRGRPFSAPTKAGNAVWMLVQITLLCDILRSYKRYYVKKWSDDWVDPVPTISGCSLQQPTVWTGMQRFLQCFSNSAKLTPRTYLLILAVVLPLNVLICFPAAGRPFYTETALEGYDIDGLLNSSSWPRGGDLVVDTSTWVVMDVNRSMNPQLNLKDKACYPPWSNEYKILAKLLGEERPKQAYCESTFGATIALNQANWNAPAWQQDDDIWDECFEFSVRMFAAIAGLIADKTLSGVGGGFLEDMTDMFDMYMLSFQDVDQLIEGRPLLGGLHVWVSTAVVFAYIALIGRALGVLGFNPLAHFLVRIKGPESDLNHIRTVVVLIGSLSCVEVPFLVLRWVAWWICAVPVSVLAVKNVLAIYQNLRLLGVFGTLGRVGDEMEPLEVPGFSVMRASIGLRHVIDGPHISPPTVTRPMASPDIVTTPPTVTTTPESST